MKKLGVFIGRFQPLHEGHIQAIKLAAKQVDVLLVLIGSANQCRSIKNPWTYSERVQMFHSKWEQLASTLDILPLNDYQYSHTQWMADVRASVEYTQTNWGISSAPTLFGHTKDGNDYLTWFPDWIFKNIEAEYTVNATSIREKMFEDHTKIRTLYQRMPETVYQDHLFYNKEKQLFANYPFLDTLNFNCSDAVLECQGHVLLIQRKFAPGAGCWALPGGFRNNKETFLDCAIRELQEETNVRVPEKVLRGSIVKTQLFDSPTRSFGLPRNTLAVYMRINPNPDYSLPRANGADDAALCKWVPLTDALNSYELYDDHAAIISTMTGVMPMPAFTKLKK
jgi:bifunctional NMN adenylyltransferase/nudix hydrolase